MSERTETGQPGMPKTLALVASAGFLLIAVETVWFYVPEFFR